MTGITAQLIDAMGDDLRVANAARVSFDKHSEAMTFGDAGLIRYLARHNHFTPFTHCMVTLRETVPIFVARQRFKHVVGFTYNEVSRRYVSDTPEFYMPDAWRKAAANVKQGSSNETTDDIELWDNQGFSTISKEYAWAIREAVKFYEAMLNAGVAPEQARMVLPQSMMTSYYVTGSLHAWARAYKLRSDTHSQLEIRDLAAIWDSIIDPLFPVSWSALTIDGPAIGAEA
jgi:thymidylate synthase (FAD)